MSITDTDAPATPTPFAAAQDPNPVKSVPPFANPLTEWRGFAAQAWAAWFNQVAQKVAEQLAQVAYSGSYNDLLQAPGTVYENPAAGLIPAMTGDNQTIATASVNPELAWRAFDYSAADQWQNTSKLASGTAVTLLYKFAAAQTPKSVSINLNRPTNGFTLEGSNDNGSTWTQLFNTSATLPASTTEYSFTFTNATGYKWFRFTVYATSNGWLAVQWLQLYGSSAQVDYGGKDFVNVGNIAAASEKLVGPLGVGGASPTAAYAVDVRGATTSQVHIAPTDVDDGTWITSYASGGHPASYLSAGAIFNGSNWIAKNSQASIIGLDPSGNFVVFFNTGLTIGATFTPTQIFSINLANGQAQISRAGSKLGIGATAPTYPLCVHGNAADNTQLHISYDGTDTGGYAFVGSAGALNLTAGVAMVNGSWTAKATGYCLAIPASAGTFSVIAGTGATPGAVVPSFPTAMLTVNPTGVGINNTNPGYRLHLLEDSAAKPSPSWTVPSDIRQKRNVEPMADDSLAIIDRLNWIRFEYNGLGSSPEGMKSIGLSAQELRELIPEAVGSVKTKLRPDDSEDTELLDIQYHYVSVHAARAIKQLSDRVKKLEAALARHLTLTE
jgi:hypothetical protein